MFRKLAPVDHMKKLKVNKPHLYDTVIGHKQYKKGDLLIVDISPRDLNQNWKTMKQTTRINNMWLTYLKYYTEIFTYCSSWQLCMEVSKGWSDSKNGSCGGRIHFHCNVEVLVPNMLSCTLGYIEHRTGDRIEVDTINDLDYRIEYVKKDSELFGSRYLYGDHKKQYAICNGKEDCTLHKECLILETESDNEL